MTEVARGDATRAARARGARNAESPARSLGTDRREARVEDLAAIAGRFAGPTRVCSVVPHGNGNINATFLVTLAGPPDRFVLQHVNTHVFPHPDLVMRNIEIVTEHVHRRVPDGRLEDGRRWEMPRLLAASDGSRQVTAPDGSCWRALSYVRDACSHDTVVDLRHAGEVGRAVGTFHRLLDDLSVERLADTLEGFHVTPVYLRHYDAVLAARRVPASAEVVYGRRFIEARRKSAGVLEDACAAGRIRRRGIHGDPKVNNVMVDAVTGAAVSLVDLDTVKPGLLHYDIGDCLRSCCNPAGEETERLDAVRFAPDLCRAILCGYAAEAGGLLGAEDRRYLFDAVRLLAFELGLRFFTDYLEGDPYFRVRHASHNLVRALVQFRLTESIEAQAEAIRTVLDEA